MKQRNACKKYAKRLGVYGLIEIFFLATLMPSAHAESAVDYVSIPPLINNSSSGDKPNVLFILDNSNSMDEAPSGQAVGSANPGSKSEIARNAVENVIDSFSGTTRMGLMAYKQGSISSRKLHDSQYDASFNPSNYDPSFTGDRASTTKRYRVPNPADGGRYIYYNVALPFYASSNFGTRFCYSSTADFDNFSEDPDSGPWDIYDCYPIKTGTSDTNSGFSGSRARYRFSPTDSDYAQNILDFGTNLTWQYVSDTWFSNSSPGRGYLHVPIGDVNSSQLTALKNKLATSQFSSSTDTPLRNAGLTPIAGTLQSALAYYSGSLPSSESATGTTPSAPAGNSCSQQDYVILVTDGLPSVDASGNKITDTEAAIDAAAAEAANLLSNGVRTYVIGFALPTGVDGSLLDRIAAAGGTNTTYLADDSDTLISSLESIFLSFANRDASSASSAVLANNSRGEGAVFQAVYSPKRDDALGNSVTWVGSLFGLFLDDKGFLREDTNQNNQLDGYNVDRVASYFFDASLGKTQVALYNGAGISTPPDVASDTPVATVDVADLKTIWEARDQLAQISDVLTQRDYDVAADTGRYIISSVDGTNILDFIQVSDARLQELVDTQETARTTLDEAQADYDVARAQYESAAQAVTDMENQMASAESERDAAQSDLATAQTNYETALSSVQSAQEGVDNAQTSFDNTAVEFTNTYESRFNTALDAIADYRDAANNTAFSSQDEFDALVSVLISEGADIADANVVSALGAYTLATQSYRNEFDELEYEIDAFEESVIEVEQLNRDMVTDLAANGNISDSDADLVISNLSGVFGLPRTELVNAYSDFSVNDVVDERQAYIDALVATGVNTNRAAVRNAVDAYDAALATEQNDEAVFNDRFDDEVYPTLDSFFGGEFDLVDNYRGIGTAQSVLDSAQLALAAAETARDDAQVVLDEKEQAVDDAQNDLVAAQEFLDPVEASFNAVETAYNTAVAAYNQATETVNNSDTLLNFLDVNTVEEAYNIVKFVRGEDGISGMRSRAIDFDDDGSTEIWRLADIVHSSPALVGAPNDKYDSRFGDRTYAAFREKYKNRRQMLYVGSNGGMLHAFNAGFWNLANKSFETTDAFAGGSSVTAHPLGAEMWAYVPRAALPHLQWMTDPNYAHTYYVDGDPITFDANIFDDDETHPYGWGTVLMIGMRFGGAPIDVDADANGSDDTTVRSSYLLFDVTDPERPPSLIAEITDPKLGFTTSVPAVIKKRVKGQDFADPDVNEWYVAFGSGPTELDDASSTQNAGLFVYDLKNKAFVSGFGPLALEANSFVGDVRSFDESRDFVDDTLYFGVTGGTPDSGSTGILKRTRLDVASAGSSTSTVLNTSEPIVSAPVVINDQLGRRWITYGTGRLFMAPDNVTAQQRHFYGIMEPVDSNGNLTWAEVLASQIEDVTDIDVYDSGAIERNSATVEIPSGNDVETFKELINAIRINRAGWRRELEHDGSDPSSRSLSRGAMAGNILFFTTYKPSSNSCQPEGTSRLYGVDVRTGTAVPFEVFDVDDDPYTVENEVSAAFISLGQGLASAPIIIKNSEGTSVFTSKSTTEQINTDVRTGVYQTGRQSWRQIILD